MEPVQNQAVDYSICLICSSLVNNSEVKVETCVDQSDDQSTLTFLLATVLEIPRDEVINQQESLNSERLETSYCAMCIQLIYSANQVYTQIVELTRKFRQVQEQIVEQISRSKDLPADTSLSTSNRVGLLEFCRNFLNKRTCKQLKLYDFNGFGYPLVVDEIPVNSLLLLPSPHPPSLVKSEDDVPPVEKVKEEPISENEEDDNVSLREGEDDYFQSSCSSSDDDDEDNEIDSESDFEPPLQPPKKFNKKGSLDSGISPSLESPENEDLKYFNKVEEDLRNPSSLEKFSESESGSNLKPAPPKNATRKKVPHITNIPVASKSTSQKKSTSTPTLDEPPQPRRKKKRIRQKKQSRFDILYPNYPKRVRDPITKRFPCLEPPCTKTFPKKTSVERHIIVQHLQDNFFKCKEPNCGKSFATSEHYKDHVSWHAGEARWKCEENINIPGPDGAGTSKIQCNEAFLSRRKLLRHVQKVHEQDKHFICELCGKKFVCQDYLSTHKYIVHKASQHSGDKKSKDRTGEKRSSYNSSPQICNYCGKSYSSKGSLGVHINMVHEKTVGKYPCQFCNHRFNVNTHLKVHMLRHHQFSLDGFQIKPNIIKNYPYQCNVKSCKKVFKKEEVWKKHMEEKHPKEGVYDFNCKYCGKGFHLKWKLDHHEEAHQNKDTKPYTCELCGSRFATMPYLKIHKKNIHKIPFDRPRPKDNSNV